MWTIHSQTVSIRVFFVCKANGNGTPLQIPLRNFFFSWLFFATFFFSSSFWSFPHKGQMATGNPALVYFRAILIFLKVISGSVCIFLFLHWKCWKWHTKKSKSQFMQMEISSPFMQVFQILRLHKNYKCIESFSVLFSVFQKVFFIQCFYSKLIRLRPAYIIGGIRPLISHFSFNIRLHQKHKQTTK